MHATTNANDSTQSAKHNQSALFNQLGATECMEHGLFGTQ
jgi:hypothetical protein